MSSTISPATQPGTTAREPAHPRSGPSATPGTDKLLLSVEEAAQRLDIGRTLFFELIRTGRIRTVRVGRLRKVPVQSLHDFVQGETGGEAEPR